MEDSGWSCPVCTCYNIILLQECTVCGFQFVQNQPLIEVLSEKFLISPEKNWTCSACTFQNTINAEKCTICETPNPSKVRNGNKKVKREKSTMILCPIPGCGVELSEDVADEHIGLHQLDQEEQEHDQWIALRRRYGFESKIPDSSNYVQQYERALEIDFSNGKITSEELISRKDYLHKRIRGPETFKTSELIPILKTCFTKPNQTVFLAGSTEFYNSDKGDVGWGCGYRNIQMICSYLIQFDQFKESLFGGCGYIPTIPVVQEWLENAWNKGFDVQGGLQLGNSVYNTKKCIGTTECAALLRSFRVKANIVDFHSTKLSAQELSKIVQNQPNPQNIKKKRKNPPMYKPNRDLINFVWKYFCERSNSNFFSNSPKKSFIPPLYLQHEGHSRTIVGIEKKGNHFNLLIFDPSHYGPALFDDLQSHKLNKIRRSIDTFTRDKYQIVYISNDQLISSFDQLEMSKEIKNTITDT